MGGIFGVVSNQNCVQTLFYGTDYHSHLGTENGGMAVFGAKGFYNTIHSISQSQFKSRFVDDYRKMDGYFGIGAIDDESPQPLIFRSKFGVYAVVATGLITNKSELVGDLLNEGVSFSEIAGGGINNAELVACLINRGDNIVEGIASMRGIIEGSICVLVMSAMLSVMQWRQVFHIAGRCEIYSRLRPQLHPAQSGNSRPCGHDETHCRA